MLNIFASGNKKNTFSFANLRTISRNWKKLLCTLSGEVIKFTVCALLVLHKFILLYERKVIGVVNNKYLHKLNACNGGGV